jgi:RHS repeat-associated protein
LRAGEQLNRVRSRYTGKERDTESGNDYFGARYYASNVGRWLSPDWSAKGDPVPYAKLDNPQSLNLYSYVYNNPINGIDPDGHYASPWHIALTFVAGLSVGMNPYSALKLGIEDAWVDVGTQGPTPEETHMHSMGAAGESPEDAYLGTVESINQAQANNNEAQVLHTIQDAYASGHGFKTWPGSFKALGPSGTLKHEIGDWLPSPGSLWGAFKASRKALKDRKASPESLLPDDPQSTSESPVGPDTSGGPNGGVHDESGERARQCNDGSRAACD